MKFGGILLVVNIIIGLLGTRIPLINDDLLFLTFPTVWAFFGGVTISSVLLFVIATLILYFIAGLILAIISKVLEKFLPSTAAMVIALLLPVLLVGWYGYSEYQKTKAYLEQNTSQEAQQQLPDGVAPIIIQESN